VPLVSLAPCFVCPFSVYSGNRISAWGKTLCYVGQNLSFFCGEKEEFCLCCESFPISRAFFWIAFWRFLGVLSEQDGTALLGILGCLSEGCYDVGMPFLN